MGSPFDEFLLWEATSRDTIDFKKIYVDMAAGDVMAGLALSEIVYYYLPSEKTGLDKLRVVHDNKKWIAVRRNEWWERTRMSPRQSDRAIGILKALKLIEKGVFKFNGDPTVHIRLNEDRFVFTFSQFRSHPAVNPFSPIRENDITDPGIPVTENTTQTTAEIPTSMKTIIDVTGIAPDGASPVEVVEPDQSQMLELLKKSIQKIQVAAREDKDFDYGLAIQLEKHGENRITLLRWLDQTREVGHLNARYREMAGVVSAAVKLSLETPGIAPRVGRIIKSSLWNGREPYLPEEVWDCFVRSGCYWYTQDWRGKKGQEPPLSGEFMVTLGRYRNRRKEAPDLERYGRWYAELTRPSGQGGDDPGEGEPDGPTDNGWQFDDEE